MVKLVVDGDVVELVDVVVYQSESNHPYLNNANPDAPPEMADSISASISATDKHSRSSSLPYVCRATITGTVE
jgi:hypothetical protein